MSLFRRKTIFHVEEALPDPEELKLRFRRRVLLLTLAGCLAVLTVPVAKELQTDLRARFGTRMFAEKILESRKIASKSRQPVSLQLGSDSRTWSRVLHPVGGECSSPATTATPTETWDLGSSWKLHIQTKGGESVAGRVLCMHPTLGLVLDQTPVSDGNLLITALREGETHQMKESAFLLVSQYGADIQMVSH